MRKAVMYSDKQDGRDLTTRRNSFLTYTYLQLQDYLLLILL